MKCDFSETQFSFCYTFEILRKYPELLRMPWFPNTVREGREGGGFDVEINFNIVGSLFLQFKIPVYLKDNKYQIKINTKDNQFQLLKKLKRPANLVYYAAPKFHESERMQEFYLADKIENNSILFSVDQFPGDGEYHRLKYEYHDTTHQSYGVLSSNPMEIKICSKIFDTIYDRTQNMSLDQKANIIAGIINEIEHDSVKYSTNTGIPTRVFSSLLIRYGILWIPILQ